MKGLIPNVDESGLIPDYDYLNDECAVWSYTPGDESWQECSTNGVYYGVTLFGTDRSLMMAGEFLTVNEDGEYGRAKRAIRKYDPEKGVDETADRQEADAVRTCPEAEIREHQQEGCNGQQGRQDFGKIQRQLQGLCARGQRREKGNLRHCEVISKCGESAYHGCRTGDLRLESMLL